jgi:hypothetical protein
MRHVELLVQDTREVTAVWRGRDVVVAGVVDEWDVGAVVVSQAGQPVNWISGGYAPCDVATQRD